MLQKGNVSIAIGIKGISMFMYMFVHCKTLCVPLNLLNTHLHNERIHVMYITLHFINLNYITLQ